MENHTINDDINSIRSHDRRRHNHLITLNEYKSLDNIIYKFTVTTDNSS